jgi:hypothetical protein
VCCVLCGVCCVVCVGEMRQRDERFKIHDSVRGGNHNAVVLMTKQIPGCEFNQRDEVIDLL